MKRINLSIERYSRSHKSIQAYLSLFIDGTDHVSIGHAEGEFLRFRLNFKIHADCLLSRGTRLQTQA
jgi:hypothetical protein